MQNEDWYVITMLIVNILTAIGTVGAVIVSLWFAWKAQKKEHQFLDKVGGTALDDKSQHLLQFVTV